MNPGLFYKQLIDKKKKIAVIGLGYVGLPLLVALDKHFGLIGFDINKERIAGLKKYFDKDNNFSKNDLSQLKCALTYKEIYLKAANFFIIAVPTPIDGHKNPDMSLLREATVIVARNMLAGSVIVYESTVYPGVTEEICIPILEKHSKMNSGSDFHVGYSPERINPGDSSHTLQNIKKIVSAQDKTSLETISLVYGKIIEAGIFKASSIKVAEAAKVIENTQRDLNIALINELSIIFSKMDIDTSEVLEAASTKWNFLKFYPGLVGGHCIGVDPYYLTYKAREIGYHPEVILAGRKINDNMGFFIGQEILKVLTKNNKNINDLRIVLFGITFKENIRDIRNSRVIDIYNFLNKHNVKVLLYDPVADKKEVKKYYGIDLANLNEINQIDSLVFCVAHTEFKKLDLKILRKKLRNDKPFLFDIKWIFNKNQVEKAGFSYWRL
jgi:UDP-N-acetyl-D-glucosamine/UDP-N-acetyl-D-galactosamine dehydrogenase